MVLPAPEIRSALTAAVNSYRFGRAYPILPCCAYLEWDRLSVGAGCRRESRTFALPMYRCKHRVASTECSFDTWALIENLRWVEKCGRSIRTVFGRVSTSAGLFGPFRPGSGILSMSARVDLSTSCRATLREAAVARWKRLPFPLRRLPRFRVGGGGIETGCDVLLPGRHQVGCISA